MEPHQIVWGKKDVESSDFGGKKVAHAPATPGRTGKSELCHPKQVGAVPSILPSCVIMCVCIYACVVSRLGGGVRNDWGKEM